MTARRRDRINRIRQLNILCQVNLAQFSVCASMKLLAGNDILTLSKKCCLHCPFHYDTDNEGCIAMYIINTGVK